MEYIKTGAVKVLRKVERYTRTDMVYMAENGFWLGIKTALAAVLALLMSVAFANLLPVHTYGEYKYVLTVLGVLSLTSLPGLGTSVVRSVARGFEGTPLAVLKAKVLWGLIGSFASLLISAYYFSQGNTGLAAPFALAALFLPFVDTLGIFSSILTGKKLFKVSILFETAVQLFSTISIGVALIFTDSLAIIFLAYFASYSVTRLIALYVAVKLYTRNSLVDHEALPHGIHLSIMEIVATVSDSINTFMLWFFIGPAPLAYYAFAKAIPLQILGGLKKLATIALPKFAERSLASIKESILRRLIILWLGLGLILIAYVLIAPYMFAALFPQYVDAVVYSQLFAVSFLFFPKKILGTILNAHARTKDLYTHTTITPIVKLALGISLVPTLGINGAIIAELASQAFALGFLWFLFIRSS